MASFRQLVRAGVRVVVTGDPIQGPSMLVVGPLRSGCSDALAVMAASMLERGTNLIVLTPRAPAFAGLGADGKAVVLAGAVATSESGTARP